MGVKYEFCSYREICSSLTLLGDPSLHEARRSNEDGWFLFKTENTDTNSISNKIFPISGKSCAVRTQGCHAFKGTDFRDFVSSLVKPNKQLIRFKSCEMFESVFNKRFLLSVKQYITYVNAESDSGVCRIPWIKMSFI